MVDIFRVSCRPCDSDSLKTSHSVTTLVAKGTITGNPPLTQIQTAQNHSGDGRKLHLSKLLSPENLWIKILPGFHYIQMNRFDFMTCFLSTKIRLLWGAVNPFEASFGPWGHICPDENQAAWTIECCNKTT